MSSDRKDEETALRLALVLFGFRGGMAQYTAQLANALSDSNPVTVLALESEETRTLFSEDVDLRLVSVDTGDLSARWVYNNLRAIWQFGQHLRRLDADVVHVPFIAGIPQAVATIVVCIVHKTVVGTIHEPRSQAGNEVDFFGVDLREQASQLAAVFLNAVIVKGKTGLDAAREVGYPMAKVHSFPHGLFSHFENGGMDAIETEESLLLFFGNLRPDKGFDRVPDILDQVAEDKSDVRAIVAGSPDVAAQIPEEDVRRTLESLRHHDRVTLRDEYIPNEDVSRLFQRASLVVLPYYDATMSGVAMIAYTFETPMVTTDVGDVGTMTERDGAGLVADPESVTDIADKVTKLLSDEELMIECQNRIHEAREQYSWANIADETLELYRKTHLTTHSK